MCGVAGEAGSREHIKMGSLDIRQMTKALTHRGPDEEGYYTGRDQRYAMEMGVRRLSIIDRKRGQQPPPCPGWVVMQNGEIYNHARLRHNLIQTGSSFFSDCDTEVIAQSLYRDGVDAVTTWEGMFAVAAFNKSTDTLFLFRDRLGKKPLYYYWDEQRNIFLWASEIKAILANPLCDKRIHAEAIYHYLCLQYVPEPMTAFKDIKAVPPGHVLTYNPLTGKVALEAYWTLKPGVQSEVIKQGTETTLQAVRSTVQNAVGERLESEVPLGVYLSGGIDSAIITGLASQQVEKLHTFTVGFDEMAFDETVAARKTAERFGTIHHEERVRVPCLPDMAERVSYQYDQPYGDCSAIPTMLLAQASKKYITVALTGDGGDEAFGGYDRYCVNDPKKGILGYIPNLFVWQGPQRQGFLSQGFLSQLEDAESTVAMLYKIGTQYEGMAFTDQMMWLDTHMYLLNDIMVKMDRASMASSVEARCPLLDHTVYELAFSIPPEQKVTRDGGKHILRAAFGDLIGAEALLRPKRGFGVPIGPWFCSDAGKQLMADMVSDICWPWGIFEPRQVANLIELHLQGRANYGHGIWMILMLHLWLKRHFG